jgi:TPR repeat protein
VAAVNLALMMIEGTGGPQDFASALQWTRKAADAGNAAGLNNLGRMYELGLGVDADLAEARRLYGEAAALGYELASENLARLG